jgi:DNA-binding CsgD family transcriptional regulator
MASRQDRFPLLPREVDVLVAAANGEKCVVTARRLGWTVAKVMHYRMRAIEVLDAVNMTHAVALAFAKGGLRRGDVDADWRARLAAAPPVIQALAAGLEEVGVNG